MISLFRVICDIDNEFWYSILIDEIYLYNKILQAKYVRLSVMRLSAQISAYGSKNVEDTIIRQLVPS
jgi:hypothetical protein